MSNYGDDNSEQWSVYRNKCVCRKIFLFYKINNKMLFPVEYVKK